MDNLTFHCSSARDTSCELQEDFRISQGKKKKKKKTCLTNLLETDSRANAVCDNYQAGQEGALRSQGVSLLRTGTKSDIGEEEEGMKDGEQEVQQKKEKKEGSL